jgi:hypothetical protein
MLFVHGDEAVEAGGVVEFWAHDFVGDEVVVLADDAEGQ